MKECILILEEAKASQANSKDDSELSVVIDLKDAAADKMRIYLTGYYQAEYLYMLTKNGLIMNHKEYSVSKVKNK